MAIKAYIVFALVLLTLPASAQSIIYVDIDATGANDGSSWADAFIYLQDALAVAQNGDEVWVAEGVYHPDRGGGQSIGDRRASFRIPSGVSVYGGFLATETHLQARDWELSQTILSGDLLDNDDGPASLGNPTIADNSQHVVVIRDVLSTITIDGVHIVAGAALDLPGHNSDGSAVLLTSSPIPAPSPTPVVRIANCVVSHNTGISGTLWLSVSSSDTPSVLIEATRISDNSALSSAGVALENSTAVLRDVRIVHNAANQATAISAHGGKVTIANSVVAFNLAESLGIVYFSNPGGRLSVWGTKFLSNEVRDWGSGGLLLNETAYLGVNNIFAHNHSEGNYGALSVRSAQASTTNSTFTFNSSSGSGSAVNSINNATIVANGIFHGNYAPLHRDLAAGGSRGDISLNYSIVDILPTGIVLGAGIQVGDPLFVDPFGDDWVLGTEDDDYGLSPGSPAIDVGSNSLLPSDTFDLDNDGLVNEPWPTDALGNARSHDGGSGSGYVDLGALEYGSVSAGAFHWPVEQGDALPTASPAVIYPNPAIDIVYLIWSGQHVSATCIQLYTVSGQALAPLYCGPLTSGARLELRLENSLLRGTYLLYEPRTGYSELLIKSR